MTDRTPARHEPIAKYRIIQRHGNGKSTIEYADDLESAMQHRADLAKLDGQSDIEEHCAAGDGWRLVE